MTTLGAKMNGDWTAIRHVIDTLSVGAVLGALIGLLPGAAAFGAIVWYSIQIYESATFQHWIANQRMKRRARKLAGLRAREKMIAAEIDAINIVKVARVEAREKLATAQHEAAAGVAHTETVLQETLPKI